MPSPRWTADWHVKREAGRGLLRERWTTPSQGQKDTSLWKKGHMAAALHQLSTIRKGYLKGTYFGFMYVTVDQKQSQILCSFSCQEVESAPHPLNQGSPCELLCPTGCGGGQVMWIPSSWVSFKALQLPPSLLPSREGARMKGLTGATGPSSQVPRRGSDATLNHPAPDDQPADYRRTTQLTHWHMRNNKSLLF